MESDHPEPLRDTGLAVRFWGYDRRQVDQALTELRARVVEAERAAAAMTGVGELVGVGDKVDEILAAAAETGATAAREAAQRASAVTEESQRLRGEADDYAAATRTGAEEYAEQVRREAEQVGAAAAASAAQERDAIVAAAQEEADEILRTARAELGRVEESIEELRGRRAAVVTAIERLSGSLGSMAVDAQQGTTEMLALGNLDQGLPADEPEDDLSYEGVEAEWVEEDEFGQPIVEPETAVAEETEERFDLEVGEEDTNASEPYTEPLEGQNETRELRPRG